MGVTSSDGFSSCVILLVTEMFSCSACWGICMNAVFSYQMYNEIVIYGGTQVLFVCLFIYTCLLCWKFFYIFTLQSLLHLLMPSTTTVVSFWQSNIKWWVTDCMLFKIFCCLQKFNVQHSEDSQCSVHCFMSLMFKVYMHP